MAAVAASNPLVDTTKLEDGVVILSYKADAKLKVIIEKNGEQVTYDLRNDGTAESFPLQMGNGSYKISILENVVDKKYKYISTQAGRTRSGRRKRCFSGIYTECKLEQRYEHHS
jgi:hypothetical protein